MRNAPQINTALLGPQVHTLNSIYGVKIWCKKLKPTSVTPDPMSLQRLIRMRLYHMCCETYLQWSCTKICVCWCFEDERLISQRKKELGLRPLKIHKPTSWIMHPSFWKNCTTNKSDHFFLQLIYLNTLSPSIQY